MAITLTDLVPLMPLLITTLTVVIAMIAVGVKRHYASVAGITIMIRCSQSMDNFVPDIGILTYKWDNLNSEFYRKTKIDT